MKVVLYWFLAIVITLAAAVYQKLTGPTYDKKTELSIDNELYKFRLVRSHGGETDCKIDLLIPDEEVTGVLEYRKFPTSDEWTQSEMTREGEVLFASLPHLPPAGKYQYKVTLAKNNQQFKVNEGIPVIIRFKGAVPGGILIPHIFFIFFAMLFANLAGIMAIFKYRKYKIFTSLTLIFLTIGGLIFGPWVQWHAFGELWAGIPFAWDLTDNKTLVAFLFWLLAFFMIRKKERPVYTIVASLVMLIIFSIPHSMFGSQLDPETGEIIQAWVQLILV